MPPGAVTSEVALFFNVNAIVFETWIKRSPRGHRYNGCADFPCESYATEQRGIQIGNLGFELELWFCHTHGVLNGGRKLS